MNFPLLFYPTLNSFRTIIQQNGFRILSIYSYQKYSGKSQFTDTVNDIEQKKKKKKTFIPRITLLGQDDNMSITTLEEAEKISKRRELKLVKIVDLDTKTQRPVYKLMTGSQYLAEDLKQREKLKEEKNTKSAIKGDKVLIISSNISEHDLTTQSNKILKWIAKQYEVRIVINGQAANMEKAVSKVLCVFFFFFGLAMCH